MNVDELAHLLGEKVKVTWSELCNEFHAKIPYVEIVDGDVLVTTFGNGENPTEAKMDYGRALAGETIKFHAYHPDAFVLQIPESMEEI